MVLNPAVPACLETHRAPAVCRLTRCGKLRCRHRECQLPGGFLLLYLHSCPASQHLAASLGCRCEAKCLFKCVADSLIIELNASPFSSLRSRSLFLKTTRFCAEWEPQLHSGVGSADAGHCACRCRALLWRASPVTVAAKLPVSRMAAILVLCRDGPETGCNTKSCWSTLQS